MISNHHHHSNTNEDGTVAAAGSWEGVEDVLNRLMAWDPTDRMTAEMLMEHPWIQNNLSSQHDLVSTQESTEGSTLASPSSSAHAAVFGTAAPSPVVC